MRTLISKTLLSLLILLINPAFGQNNDIWIFGDQAGIDFNGGPPKAIVSKIFAREGCASICDNEGRLLFYTNGDSVWNANHILMPNGIDLGAGGTAIAPSTSQGALIVPNLGNPQQYYIFTLGAAESGYYAGKLYYSIVDMSLNGGMGDVSTKGIFLAANLTEQMTAVAGANCNIWLLAVERSNGYVKAWNIDDNGIDTIPVISSGVPITRVYGCMDVSPDGTKLVLASASTALFDFNTSTGMASNPIVLYPYANYNYGVCFSPDNSKLYESGLEIRQYDLSLTDPNLIINSRTVISNSRADYIKRGPDGKLYCAGGPIDIIEQPNLPGLSCQFVKNGLALLGGTRIGAGLPNTIVKRPERDSFYTSKIIKAGCFADQVTLSPASSGRNYLWDDGSTSPQRLVDKEGIYWLQYQIACDVFVDTFKVIFPNGTLPGIHTRSSCKGLQAGKGWVSTYPGDTVNYHYLWQNINGDTLSLTDTLHSVPAGNYTLRIITITCDTLIHFIVPEESYRVSFLADSIVCQGTELTFQNTSDTGFIQFHWDFGDGDQSLLNDPLHTYYQTGSYEVILIGIGKLCTDTVKKTIVVDSMYSGNFINQPDSICVGESISFYPEIDSTIVNLLWQFGDGGEMNSGVESQLQYAYETSGTMPVKLTMQFRVCPGTSFVDTVYVFTLPDIDLGLTVNICHNSSPVMLKNIYGQTADLYHLWNTGDTTESIKVAQPGIYSLTVSSAPLGCSNTESVEIIKDCYIDIPNAFTPNGDGENDYFFPRQLLSKNITRFRMQIFNRWGKVLFETNNIHGRGWDGNFNGKKQPEGVYIYIIEAEINSSKDEIYEGNVTLLR